MKAVNTIDMVKYRLATIEDNLKLIQLSAATNMAGDIGLRIDRNPDFFSLLKLRGDTKVFIAEERDVIIGFICVSLQQVYVGREVFPLQYIGDFKVLEQYRHQGIGLQLCNNLADFVIAQNADLTFLNVSKGNSKPLSFFKNRPNVPDFDNIGTFKIYQIIGKRMKQVSAVYAIEEATINDEVVDFFNRHYRNYQLGPVITKAMLGNTSVFVVRQSEKIIAAMSLIDTMSVKQNVITSLSRKMKILLKLINIYSSIAGLSKMPLLYEPVKMLYIKYIAVDSKDREIVKSLINFARNITFEKSYSYVSIGLHEKDSINNCLSGIPRLTFRSVGMLLSIKNNRDLIKKVINGIPYEDYSLV